MLARLWSCLQMLCVAALLLGQLALVHDHADHAHADSLTQVCDHCLVAKSMADLSGHDEALRLEFAASVGLSGLHPLIAPLSAISLARHSRAPPATAYF